jgi:hypothetical protein
MTHSRKAQPGHLDRERFDFAGPDRSKALSDACQRKAADPVKQAAEGQRFGQYCSFMPEEGASSSVMSIPFAK